MHKDTMNETKHNNLLADIDVESIVKASLKAGSVGMIEESYVAETKPFKQVSELVSQRTKDAHGALYRECVEALNRVSSELDTADRAEANSKHSEYRTLKHDEVKNLNSVWLHELYFSNCFDPNSEIFMDSKAYMKLQEGWATFDDWQKDMMSCAMACGDGWAVCGYSMFLKKIVNTVIEGNDKHVMAGLYPLVVIDLHEHSYFRDYLNDKKSYVVAMMRELDWNVIEERFLKAEALHKVLK